MTVENDIDARDAFKAASSGTVRSLKGVSVSVHAPSYSFFSASNLAGRSQTTILYRV